MRSENIDIEKLRNDLLNESMGAFYVGGYGGALLEATDILHMSAYELINAAERMGIDITRYITAQDEDGREKGKESNSLE